ncbi:MAG: hypothetical protein ACRD0K_23205 [Egibacteraceae bacterium]
MVGLAGTLFLGLIFGMALGMAFGGLVCLQHLVLRGLLAYHGCAPLRYVSLLNEATGQLLLRRVGSGYMFVHRMLLDYFAELGPVTRSSKKSLTSVAASRARA